MGHRGGYGSGDDTGMRPGALPDPAPTPIDPRHFRGYDYFLGEPTPAQRTTLGADPASARALVQALFRLLPIGPLDDNTRIPSGYTYLLQFVAHDLVDTAVPFWVAAEAGVPSRNMRQEGLVLDTLYGGGPTVCPIAFEPDARMLDDWSKLRLGRIADADALGLTGGVCPMRDLARLKMDAVPPPSNFQNASQVFVADERNDDNTVLSQIAVLFSILHNASVARLVALTPQARFAHARIAMLTMFHAVIRADLLKRLLHPGVYETLATRPCDSQDWLWRGETIPLEFTHGAFRVGHAMVRAFYVFNDDPANTFPVSGLLSGPGMGGDPARDPLPSNWIVAWSKFFDMGGTPNYSLKLAIHQQLPLDFGGLFSPIAPNSPEQLTLRDWLSAANARMWRVDALVDAAKAAYPALTFLDATAVAGWLNGLLRTDGGTPADRDLVRQNMGLLATDLPLPLYVLLEAQLDPAIAGAHMGALGSVIVGETIFRRIATEALSIAEQVPAAKAAFGADWDRIQAVGSMPDLVRLAADWGNLADCPRVPFIAASQTR